MWTSLTGAIRTGQPAPTFPGWTAASDPKASAQRLADLTIRRSVARALEEVALDLYQSKKPAQTLIAQLEESFARARRAVDKMKAGRLLWSTELLVKVMDN